MNFSRVIANNETPIINFVGVIFLVGLWCEKVAKMANAHQETLVDFKAVRFGSVLGMVQNIGSTPILFTNFQASSLFGGACLVVRRTIAA